MADVPACTASHFLIFHQYLQMFHFLLQEHLKIPPIFWKNFFSALLPLLGTVTELPAEGKAHANSSMFTLFLSIWPIASAFITYDPVYYFVFIIIYNAHFPKGNTSHQMVYGGHQVVTAAPQQQLTVGLCRITTCL